MNNDGLIDHVLENTEIDFDLWDIENLQPPPNETPVSAAVADTLTWPKLETLKTEIKPEPVPQLTPTLTHPTAGIVVSPLSTVQPQPQPQIQPVQTTIVSTVESPTIRNLLTRNGRVQDLMNGQKIIFHPIGSNSTGNTILVSSNGQPLLLQVSFVTNSRFNNLS